MCDAFLPEMCQTGLFEVEYLVPYLTWDNSGPRCSTSKNAVGLGRSRSLKTTAFDRPHANALTNALTNVNVCWRWWVVFELQRNFCAKHNFAISNVYLTRRQDTIVRKNENDGMVKICGLTRKQNFRIRTWRFDAKRNTDNTEPISRYFEIPTTNTVPTWKKIQTGIPKNRYRLEIPTPSHE